MAEATDRRSVLLVVDALAGARRDALCELAFEWGPDEHPELSESIDRLSDDLVAEAPR